MLHFDVVILSYIEYFVPYCVNICVSVTFDFQKFNSSGKARRRISSIFIHLRLWSREKSCMSRKGCIFVAMKQNMQ